MGSLASTQSETDILENLKCVNCNLYLSVPPIMYNKENSLVCGRCRDQPNFVIRAKAYETVASKISFPCRYKNACTRRLNWNEVEEHEAACVFEPFPCPSTESCNEKICASMILEHFQKEHKLSVNNSKFNIELEKSFRNVTLTKALGQLFLVEIRVYADVESICFGITHIAPQQETSSPTYTGTVELINPSNDITSKFTCAVKSIRNWTILKANLLVIETDSIKNVLKTSSVLCKITIAENAKSKQTSEEKNSNTYYPEMNPKVDMELLEKLECPICNEYMISLIYVCSNGHSICGNCKAKIHKCPHCRISLGTTRNLGLEDLASSVSYPCNNSNFGCKFVGNSSAILNHNKDCALNFVECSLKLYDKCNWQGLSQHLLSHTKIDHANKSIAVKEKLHHDLNNAAAAACNIIFYENQIFKVLCKYDPGSNGIVSWHFQHVGMGASDVSPYIFEIVFLDQTNNKRMFTIDAFCQTGTESSNTLNIPRCLLCPFIDNEKLHFKYDIKRK